MTVTLISSALNHHFLPFCLAMNKLTNGNFTFVATKKLPQERLSMGYADMNTAYNFVLRAYEAPESAMKLAVDSDVVIIGSAPEEYVASRLQEGKITFRYSERVFKKGYHSLLSPRVWYYSYLRNIRYKNDPLYMLCASAYTAADYSKLFAYKNKCFKWGYFPPFIRHDIDDLLQRKNSSGSKVSLLWAGRLIDWKHPELAISVAEKLKNSNYDFELNIIGCGEMENYLAQSIEQKGLHNVVHLLGSATPENVRKYMEASHIFLFTSDFNEGWGAVVNEAMNSGCAVVASHAAGSVPFLIEDEKNGLIYRNGDQKQLFRIVKRLIDEPALRENLGVNAYNTLSERWNADEAANRFLELSKALLTGLTPYIYHTGPCSAAPVISNRWY